LTDTLNSEIKDLEKRVTDIRAEMNALKAELYRKFGDNINLEND